MAESLPRRGVKEVNAGTSTGVSTSSTGLGCKNESSKMFPGMNFTGNVSGEDLNTACPISQNSAARSESTYARDMLWMRLTRFDVRCNDLARGKAICDGLSRVVADTTTDVEEEGSLSGSAQLKELGVRWQARDLQPTGKR